MKPSGETLDQAYFDELYRRNPDPWQFATSPYEDGKYTETLSVLERPHYAQALEVGCSIGAFTDRLAGRCGMLDALDIAETALAQARERTAAHRHIRFWLMNFPAEIPAGHYDLILLSEMLYFLSDADLALAAALTCERLRPGGDVLLVHWLGETPDFPSTGDRASDAFITAVRPQLSISRQLRRDRYRIDLLRRQS